MCIRDRAGRLHAGAWPSTAPPPCLHSIGRVAAVCCGVLDAAIFAAGSDRWGGHPWLWHRIFVITRCSSVCFYNIRLLAAATALHRCHDRGASLPPRIGHGRGWAVVARFVLCRSVCRVCCVPCVGFLASPIVAGKFKSRTISANRTISALSCSRSRVS